MKTEFGEQGRPSWRPIGQLAETLERFQAPTGTQRVITRRIGNLAGTKQLPMDKVTRVIEESMGSNGGMPDWRRIEDRFAGEVHEIYLKFRRF